MTAIVLVGGEGSRLRSVVPDLPKPLVPAADKPFLHWVARWISCQGETEIVLAARRLAEKIQAWAQAEQVADPALRLSVCVEPEPLGTGGAVKFAAARAADSQYLVLNGDSLVFASLSPAYAWLRQDASLDGVIVGISMPDTSRYGTLDVGSDGKLRGFVEKKTGQGLINAGIYLLRRRLLDELPVGNLSMERDCFARWLSGGASIAVGVTDMPFLDIGTPESFAQADAFIAANAALLAPGRMAPVVRWSRA